MIPLSKELKKNKYTYKQVERNDYFAIYEQWSKENILVGYEVFQIKKQKETTFPNGTIYPPQEAMPSNESFGKTAWAYTTLQPAYERYKELVKYGIKHLNTRVSNCKKITIEGVTLSIYDKIGHVFATKDDKMLSPKMYLKNYLSQFTKKDLSSMTIKQLHTMVLKRLSNENN